MNYLNQVAGMQTAAMPDIKQAPMQRLDGAKESLQKAVAQLAEVTDMLCGSEPASGAEKDGARLPDGLFGAIGMQADAINGLADRIAQCAGRIARQIS